MSAHTFIHSFKRFSSRRGLPALMISDNRKTFEAAARIIKRVLSNPRVQKFFHGIGIEWRFNVPRAPWWGGLFERLVRSTKQCLRKVLGRSKFSYEEVLTILAEIEMVLNFRPLTYVTTDDSDEPLTPSHLLVGWRLMNFPDHLVVNHEVDSEGEDSQLSAQLKPLNRSLDAFWRRWRREYLLELRETHRHHRSSGKPQIAEGDVVVVYSEYQPCSCWSLGRIERLITGADGQMRATTVRVSRKGHVSVLDRPIQHLYPLEVVPSSDPAPEEENEDNVSDEEPASETLVTSRLRPKRFAASKLATGSWHKLSQKLNLNSKVHVH